MSENWDFEKTKETIKIIETRSSQFYGAKR